MARVTPISAELVARATVSYDAVQAVGETIYWIEGRSDGDVLVRWTAADGRQDVLPEGFHVASQVHEYGGGAYLVTERDVWFCNADDQRIYHVRDRQYPVPVTPAPVSPGALRYADLRLLPGTDNLVSVRERHEEALVHNELVVLPGDGSAEPMVIASGDDFYMSPEPSSDGRQLTWVSWNAPLMPWDGARLWLADFQSDGTLTGTRLVAGGDDESVCQPQWSGDGRLHFVSDRSGWWNLYAWCEGRTEPVITGEFEVAAAPWEFGYRTYSLQDAQVTAIIQHGPSHSLVVRRFGGDLERLVVPHTSIKPYLANTSGGKVAFIGSSPTRLPTVVLAEPDGSIRELTSADVALDLASLVRPEPFTFSTRDGGDAHGLYYPPLGGSDRLPPLLMRAHPGPTANWPLRLDLHAQYFTSRGFAVADIDYRGSTGYGRAYRLGLRHRWGLVDATDCADSARYLVSVGHADPGRMTVWGASAGGYTVLRALAVTDVFTAGIARSAVVDMKSWSGSAPKFQAHHTKLLGSDLPYRADECEVKTRGSLLLIHGDEDRVTSIGQVQALAKHLNSVLIVVPAAGHTLRKPSDLQDVLFAELNFILACLRR